MIKKLSQICEDLKKEFYGNYKDNAERRIGFEDGFKAAIESEEIKGLVEALKYYGQGAQVIGFDRGEEALRALKPFEGELDE